MSRVAQNNALVLSVLARSTFPIGASCIARQLEVQDDHWWAFSPNCRVLVSQVLKRTNAVKHPGGKYTSPLRA